MIGKLKRSDHERDILLTNWIISGQSESVENILYNSVPERDMGFSQTHQDELRDDGSLTGISIDDY